MKKFAVIMAGGIGAKLWPRSTKKNPKQFAHFIGEGTMIENTVHRLKKCFAIKDIYMVIGQELKHFIKNQVPDIPEENIIIEPLGKNTAPCIELANIHLREKYASEDIMCVFPSDHVINNIGDFEQSLEVSIDAAHELKGIVTIGIEPTRAETQYGYVQIKEEQGDLGEYYKLGLRYSTTFAEKPDKETAKRFLESGDFLWNSGIFIWRLDTLQNSINKYLPDQSVYFNTLPQHLGKDSYIEALDNIYRQINSISIDYAIMEKADNVYVNEASFIWSDLGTWDEVYRLSMKDARNNVVEGDVVTIDTYDSFVSSSSGTLVGVVGLKDVIVVESDEAILVCKKGQSEQVMELIEFMRRKHIKTYL